MQDSIMSAPTTASEGRSKPRGIVEICVLAISTLVTVGVAVLFLVVTGANPSRTMPHQRSGSHTALIQYGRTGAPATATRAVP
jgi:hypothetical protein